MRRAFKYRILPTEEQAVLINKTVGCARLTYNSLLLDYKEQLNNEQKPQMKEVTFLKEQFPFLKEVDSLALANAKQHLISAFTNFFQYRKGKRKGKKVGFPKVHKKCKSKLSYTTNNQNGTIRLEGDMIKLPKLGFVNVVLHRELCGRITSCTIEQTRDGKYYASISVEVDDAVKEKDLNKIGKLKVVGIDMSMSDFAVDSDTGNSSLTKPKYERNYRKYESKLAKLQRNVSRKVRGSKNKDKARAKYAKLSRHVSNKRLDFCHKLSRYYAENYDVVVLEDLDMQNMARTLKLGKSVNDLGFGMFKEMLSYKCKECDSLLMYADKWFASSQTCSKCGCINKDVKDLKVREWTCPACGEKHDRDVNAAKNLRNYFYTVMGIDRNNTDGTSEIYASGEGTSTLREAVMQAASLNEEEAPNFRWG